MAPSGDATVVWLEEGSCANGTCTEFQVMTRQVRADGSLGQARRLTPDNTDADSPNDAIDPRLAVDGGGRALVAWLRPDDNFETRVEVVLLDPAGAPLGPPQPMSPDGDNVGEVGLGMNAAGQGVVVWAEDGGVQARRFDVSGPGAATITLLPEDPDRFQDDPVVAVDSTGAATVAWNDIDVASDRAAIRARRLGATDVTGAIHELDSWAQTIGEPVAVDVHPASGTATILWTHLPDAGFVSEVRGARIGADDVLSQFAVPVAFDEAANPDVAVAPNGDALAVYDIRLQPTSLTKNVVGERIAADGTTGDMLFLSGNNIDAVDPQVDLAPDGTAFVGWVEETPLRRVMAARIPAGGAPEAPEPLLEGPSAAESAAVAADLDGSALAAFSSDDAVRALHFDGEPPEISAVGFPSRAFVGQELLFGALVEEELSDLAGLTWSFGDGARGAVPLISHAFAAPGTFPVELRVADTVGNEDSRTGAVAVGSLPRTPVPGGGGSGGTPSGGGIARGAPAAVAKPAFTVGSLPRRMPRRRLLARGLSVRLTAPVPLSFNLELLGRLRGARLTSPGDLVLAERRLGAAAGTRTARLRVSRALRRHVRRGARLQVRITATGADGGAAVLMRRLRIR